MGDLAIFIDKGILKLHTVQSNVNVNMYAGTVFATAKNRDLNIHSNLGNIKIDSIFYQKDFQRKGTNSPKFFKVNTIKGIIYITTQ